MKEIFSKVMKMGDRKYVQIPAKDAEKFDIGDPVWIRKIGYPGGKGA